MKKHYQIKVREYYSKYVNIYADNEDDVFDEIGLMEENGEIEWDRAEDFENWEVLSVEEIGYADCEVKRVKKWCHDMVEVTAIIDNDWVESEMDEYQCMDWLAQMYDRGIHIPDEVTSSDLWEAVLEYRKKGG